MELFRVEVQVHHHLHLTGEDGHELGLLQKVLHEVLTLKRSVKEQGDKIMAQIDDLKAAQAATQTALDTINAKVDEIQGEVVALDQEVKDLIALIGTNPDLSEVLAAAQAIQAKTEAMVTKVQTVDDTLDTIPPRPA